MWYKKTKEPNPKKAIFLRPKSHYITVLEKQGSSCRWNKILRGSCRNGWTNVKGHKEQQT